MLTTKQAAERLGVTPDYIRALIIRGQLVAVKHGRDWDIDEADLARIKRLRRPRKPKD